MSFEALMHRCLKILLIRIFALVIVAIFSTGALADSLTFKIQQALSDRGYDVGTLDGIWGSRTQTALESFLRENGLSYDGSLGANEFSLLGILETEIVADTTQQSASSPARNPQWYNYRNYIKSPLRDLRVPANFTLIQDWDALMRVHASRLTGRYDETSLYYSTRIDFDHCIEDLSATNTTRSSRSGEEGVVPISAMCHSLLGDRFNNNPAKYALYYRQILLNWLTEDTLKNANRLQARFSPGNDYAYALQSNVAKVMAHYAIYHRLYDIPNEQHVAIVHMMEDFVATYEFYPAFKKLGPYFIKGCDLRNARVLGGNDFCGSWNTRMAVGATMFGLEFESQLVFDKGIQNTEIMLGMFDKNAMYTAQIGRGMEGLAYARQVLPAIDQIDFALKRAFGFDFAGMVNIHGTTPGEVYKHMLDVAYDPSLMLPYYNAESDPSARYRGYFKDVVSEISAGSRPPQDVWGAFQESQYFLTAPGLARRYYPDLFAKYWPQRSRNDYEIGNFVTGFSALTVRESEWK